MSAAPFASLVESFLEDKFGILEGTMIFESGETWDYGYGGESFSRNVFTITVYGTNTEGLNTIFEDGEAVQLLDEMFAWRGAS